MKSLFFELSSKTLRGKSGVYKITCKNHSYIGSSKSLYDRLRGQRKEMENGTHHNTFMQNCYNKYEKVDFKFEILEYTSAEERFIREDYWMEKLKPDINISKSAVNGKPHTSSFTRKGRPVIKYSLKDEELKEYPSPAAAAKDNGVQAKHIVKACKRYHLNGMTACKDGVFRFKYKYSKVKKERNDRWKSNVLKHFEATINGEKISLNYRDLYDEIVTRVIEGNYELNFNIKQKNLLGHQVKKFREFREHPEMDNPEPSLSRNGFEGAETRRRH